MAVALPSLVCAQQPAPPEKPLAAPNDVAARMGDRVITVAEVDEAWRQADSAAHAQAAQALYDGRKQALDRLVADLLIEQAAKARGKTAAEFTKEEVAARARPVAEADVEAFYRQNAARLQGKQLDEVRGAIRGFLEQQQQASARAALISELRKTAPALTVALEPPRQKVDVADADPARGGPNAKVVIVEYSDYQ